MFNTGTLSFPVCLVKCRYCTIPALCHFRLATDEQNENSSNDQREKIVFELKLNRISLCRIKLTDYIVRLVEVEAAFKHIEPGAQCN